MSSKSKQEDEKKFNFKEWVENTAIEDRKKSYDKVKKEWRDLMLDNPLTHKEEKQTNDK